MSAVARYAIYHVPPADAPLYRFGAALVGYDGFAPKDLAQPAEAAAPGGASYLWLWIVPAFLALGALAGWGYATRYA